jgi:hypothetical protein
VINIFSDNKKKKKNPKHSTKRKRKTSIDLAEKVKENLDKLNPMVIPLLAVKLQENPNNDFLKSSISVITERPHRLTDKWISSLNRWADSIAEAVMLDEPDIEVGTRTGFGPLAVYKVVKANMEAPYPMPAIICVDERGWKWYFKTSKAYDFSVGETITFTAKVSAHKEGITFLNRPSKIKKVVNILIETEEECNDQ